MVKNKVKIEGLLYMLNWLEPSTTPKGISYLDFEVKDKKKGIGRFTIDLRNCNAKILSETMSWAIQEKIWEKKTDKIKAKVEITFEI